MDWFADFCDVALGQRAAEQLFGAPPSRKQQKKRGRDAEASGTSKKRQAHGSKPKAMAGVAARFSEDKMLELAARFSQATAELQMMGMWRQSRMRKEQAVQKAFYPASASAELVL